MNVSGTLQHNVHISTGQAVRLAAIGLAASFLLLVAKKIIG
jgi:hypothetical protein